MSGGSGVNFFFAEVVKVKGKHEEHDYNGDVQIRVEIDQDDKERLKKEDLRWARSIFPVTLPQHRGLGFGGCAMIPGTRVFGFYADADRQIPFIMGTMSTAGEYCSLDKKKSSQPPAVLNKKQAEDQNLKNGKELKRDKLILEGAVAFDEEDEKKNKDRLKTKDKTPEEYGKTDAGEKPAKSPDKPHLGSKKEPDGNVPDIMKYLISSNINPQNIGGFASTFPALQSLKKKKEGTVVELLGQKAFSMMKMMSAVSTSSSSNMMQSMQQMSQAASNLKKSVCGDTQKAMEIMQNNFYGAIDLNAYQQTLLNISMNMVQQSDSNLESLNTTFAKLDNGESLTGTEISDIAFAINNFSNFSNPQITLEQLMLISMLVSQIEKILQTGEEDPCSLSSTNTKSQLESIARQLGSILGIGEQLLEYVDSPDDMIIRVEQVVNSKLGIEA